MSSLLNVTVGELLKQKAELHPDHEAVVYADRNLRLSYKEFDDQCNLVAKGLMRLGINKNDHIAIWATNTPEWLTCQFATGKMGGVLVTVIQTIVRHQNLNIYCVNQTVRRLY